MSCLSRKLTVFIVALPFIACSEKPEAASVPVEQAAALQFEDTQATNPAKQVSALDYEFFGDSVLPEYRAALKYYFAKYSADTCAAVYYNSSQLRADFEGVVKVGVIRKKSTEVFVLGHLTKCENDSLGQSYYFSDTTLPRLVSGSDCCHPSNIFLVGDINEDGTSEIGEFYSGCVSRYKALRIYSLKDSHWQEIGSCIYDLFYADSSRPYKYFVRKTGKKKFEMLEITDLAGDKTKAGKQNWLHFSM